MERPSFGRLRIVPLSAKLCLVARVVYNVYKSLVRCSNIRKFVEGIQPRGEVFQLEPGIFIEAEEIIFEFQFVGPSGGFPFQVATDVRHFEDIGIKATLGHF